MDTEAVHATPLPKKRRKRNPDQWQRNLPKKSINSGKNFVWKNRKGEEKVHLGKSIREGSRCEENKCKKQCKEISDDRQRIHDEFWAMGNVNLQRGFILQHVEIKKKQRERKRNEEKDGKNIKRRTRTDTRIYSFFYMEKRRLVVRIFFFQR